MLFKSYMEITGVLIQVSQSLAKKAAPHVISQQWFTYILTSKATETTYPVVNDEVIANVKLPIPSLEKQQEIVGIIEPYDRMARMEEESLKVLEDGMMRYIKNDGLQVH